MFCQKCQVEAKPVADLWGNERCPTCKGLAQTVVINTAPQEADLKGLNASVAPGYQEYLKTTSKFNSRKKLKKIAR